MAATPLNPMDTLRNAPLALPCTKKLKQLLALTSEDPCEIFKFRLLCRKGLSLFVGPSGIGKSTMIGQGVFKWCLGMEHFGFSPLRPLRILIVQAENDDHDLAELFKGVVASLHLSTDQLAAVDERLDIRTTTAFTGLEFCEALRRLIIEHRADLVVIDPALAFLGGDTNSQVDVGRFIRQGIGPVLAETNSAAILIHHTAKPTWDRGKSHGRSDAYAGVGSSEWANCARLVFGLNPTEIPDHYELFIAKRGKRAGWKDASGKPMIKQHIRHSRKAGEIMWFFVNEKEFEEARAAADVAKAGPTLDEFISLFPEVSTGDPSNDLLSTDQLKGIFKAQGWTASYAKLRDDAVARGDLRVFGGGSIVKLTGRTAFVARIKNDQNGQR